MAAAVLGVMSGKGFSHDDAASRLPLLRSCAIGATFALRSLVLSTEFSDPESRTEDEVGLSAGLPTTDGLLSRLAMKEVVVGVRLLSIVLVRCCLWLLVLLTTHLRMCFSRVDGTLNGMSQKRHL